MIVLFFPAKLQKKIEKTTKNNKKQHFFKKIWQFRFFFVSLHSNFNKK